MSASWRMPSCRPPDMSRALANTKADARLISVNVAPIIPWLSGNLRPALSYRLGVPGAICDERARGTPCGESFGVDLEVARHARIFLAAAGRASGCFCREGGPYTLIDESYNANPGPCARRLH